MKLRLARRRGRTADPGARIYAIGDIHGRLDLFEEMIQRIMVDVSSRAPRHSKIVILGDFIDRGEQSAQLVNLFMRLRKEQNVIVLKGNHEAIMVDALAGDYSALDLWLAHGGDATLRSYGIDDVDIDAENGSALLRLARQAIGKQIPLWLKQLPTFVHHGDYYLVHAGIKPGVALAEQTDESRLWIGEEFLNDGRDHGAIIVHGHSIQEDGVLIAPNRIAVDTGAYRTGRLSAVRLDEDVAVITATGIPPGLIYEES